MDKRTKILTIPWKCLGNKIEQCLGDVGKPLNLDTLFVQCPNEMPILLAHGVELRRNFARKFNAMLDGWIRLQCFAFDLL